jgi:YesN/AraC family two-component response regulator
VANILIVDDEPLVVETLSNAIADRGHSVETAGDGVQAMKRFTAGKFDLVITDIIMPVKEGIELIMELRRVAPGIKIVAISGGGRTGNVEFLKMAQQLGATETLHKPIRLADFYATLDRCLGAGGAGS